MGPPLKAAGGDPSWTADGVRRTEEVKVPQASEFSHHDNAAAFPKAGTRVCFSLLSGLGSDSNPSRSTNPCEGRCGSAVLCLSTQEQQKLTKEMQKLGGKQIRIF